MDNLQRKSEYIDTTADVQQEPAPFAVSAGIGELRLFYRNGSLSIPVKLTILTSTGLHRGVHMSRLVHAASLNKAKTIDKWLREICEEINKTQPGSEVTCSFEYPYSDRFADVTIKVSKESVATYKFRVNGITACPCSKKMVGIGHMQRAEIILILKSRKSIDINSTISKIEECFSAVPKEEMKRIEEAKKIIEAQENPKFAEDLVRDCLQRFPNALYVLARCYESIHLHDAVAVWSIKPGWVPAI